MATTLYIVIPCYNEQEVLRETAARLLVKLRSLKEADEVDLNSRVLFVDDGSKDGTWQIIEALHREEPAYFSGLKLSRNCGHQSALLAGLMTAKELADAVISMDADLQDDIDAIDGFLREYHSGSDIVYGVRSDRTTDMPFKRIAAQTYYKILAMLGADIVYNHADYRLMSRRALEALADFSEVNLFLRGVVPLIGFQTAQVSYKRGERFAGESKYPLRKMLSFGWDGITSLSVKPIRFVTVLGFVISLVSLCFIIYSIYVNLTGKTVAGWSTLMVSIWMIGGLQLLALGIIGEYIGKIYKEVKARPKYIIDRFLNKQ